MKLLSITRFARGPKKKALGEQSSLVGYYVCLKSYCQLYKCELIKCEKQITKCQVVTI